MMRFWKNLSVQESLASALILVAGVAVSVSFIGLNLTQDRWQWAPSVVSSASAAAEANLQESNTPIEVTADRSGVVWVYAIVLAVNLAAFFGAFLLLCFIFEPLTDLTNVLRKMRVDSNFSHRVACDGNGELSTICGSVNTLLARAEVVRRSFDRVVRGIDSRVASQTASLSMERDLAEFASTAKTNFLASMSHEIRTPMTAILGYAQMLVDEEASRDTLKEHAGIIGRNGQHLLSILDEILDLSKIEAGRMSVERVACKPAQIVTDVAAITRPLAANKGLNFNVICRNEIPTTIQTDTTRLRQILMNLISNAIKFTEKGSVTLAVSFLEGKDSTYGWLSFEVIDTGIGMTQNEIHRIFNPFTQAATDTRRRFGGTGLGLSISKRLAELLGGTIEVESAPGQGSNFHFIVETGSVDGVSRSTNLSYSAANDAPVNAVAANRVDGLRLLLAEDCDDNRRLISRILEKSGAHVEVAEDGRAAIEAILNAGATGNMFDVVLMDMQMPVIDGVTAVRELRRAEYHGPIIALTASALSQDYWKCLDAGCDDYVTKPIDTPKLVATIRQYAQKFPMQAVEQSTAENS